jgi:hypothetical protein
MVSGGRAARETFAHGFEHWRSGLEGRTQLEQQARAFAAQHGQRPEYTRSLAIAHRAGRVIGAALAKEGGICDWHLHHGDDPGLRLLVAHAFRSGYEEALLGRPGSERSG